MKKFILTAIVILLIYSLWLHKPWGGIWTWFYDSNIKIPDRLELLLSALTAFFLVLFVEWLRGSDVEFYIPDPLLLPHDNPDRKFLKLGIEVKNRILGKLLNEIKLLPSNAHAFASLTAQINHVPKPSYRAKWDIAPEPLEYPHSEKEQITLKGKFREENKQSKDFEFDGNLVRKTSGHPRPEMIPLAMQTANLFPGDKAETSIAVKHKGETNFWIYDPEYYFGKPDNRCFLTKAYLKVIFKSSLGKWEAYFCIANTNDNFGGFTIERISEEEFNMHSRCK